MKKIIIAIDGPAGSGKSTTAKLLAKKLNYLYIDSGAMYRAVALYWLRSGKEYDESIISDLVPEIHIEIKQSDIGQRTILNGEDVSELIRTPDVTKYSSPISAFQSVRDKLVAEQRQMGINGGVVMDGRDIGTVVFPNAELKVFLSASIDARTERRAVEIENNGVTVNREEIRQSIIQRDMNDSTRVLSPLKRANDAIEIDTSNLTIEQQTNLILEKAIKLIN